MIQHSDFFSIGATEGRIAVNGNAGAKQTHADDSLQSRLFALLGDDDHD